MSRRPNAASRTSTNAVRRRAKARKALVAEATAPPRVQRKRVPKKPRRGKNYFGESVGGGIGGLIGGDAGQALGTKLGKGAQKMFREITGWGDYTIQGNSLMNGGMSPPQILNSIDNGGYIVRHREFLGDIYATTDFTVQNYEINPGVSTFPWLSNVAGSFEEYKFRGLIFEFKSTSSDSVLSSAASTSLGSVVMATDYNVLNPNFLTKVAMENYEFANSAKPSMSFYHPVECKQSQTPVSLLFVRNGPVPTNGDARLYDLGNFQIATVGMQAPGGILGELWATYEIELYKPKYNNGETIYTDHFQMNGIDNTHNLGTTTQATTLAAITAAGNKWSNNGSVSTNGGSYFFPAYKSSGNYLVVISYNFDITQQIFPIGILELVNCVTVGYWQGDQQQGNYPPVTSVTSSFFTTLCYIIKITGEDAVISLANQTFIGGGDIRGDLWVTQINPQINS